MNYYITRLLILVGVFNFIYGRLRNIICNYIKFCLIEVAQNVTFNGNLVADGRSSQIFSLFAYKVGENMTVSIVVTSG